MIKIHLRPRNSGKTTELVDMIKDLDMLDYRIWVFVKTEEEINSIKKLLGKNQYDPNNIQIFSGDGKVIGIRGKQRADYILIDNIEHFTLNQLMFLKQFDIPIIGWATHFNKLNFTVV